MHQTICDWDQSHVYDDDQLEFIVRLKKYVGFISDNKF